MPGEIALIQDYLAQGGNLLWLADPEQTASLSPLAEQLGIAFVPGTVMDPSSSMLGLDDPRFVLISDYANHPFGVANKSVTLMADALAIETSKTEQQTDWQYLKLLRSQPGCLGGIHRYQPELTCRNNAMMPDRICRGRSGVGTNPDPPASRYETGSSVLRSSVTVTLSVTVISALWLIWSCPWRWLTGWQSDDKLIEIPVKTSIGTQLELDKSQSIIIGFGFLLVIPLILLAFGLGIWWRRRRR